MNTQSLLPSGSTEFERAMEAATALDARAPAIRPNARAKLDGFDPFVPWLIWEYGLGDILPYLSDPQRALREGIRWQRLRGTPEALRLAFSWRDLDGVQVFQEEPGQHFAAFQIDTNAVPPLEDIDDLIALARLSAPARSRLARIFHGYDLRRIKLDDTRLGDGLLSDYSGVLHTDGQTRLSFGRVFPATVPAPEVRTHAGIFIDHFGRAFLPGRFVLSVGRLDDDRATANPFIYHSHLFTLANAEGVSDTPANFLPTRRFQRAQMVLSDGMRLGDTNSRTPPVDWIFYEGRRRLSEGAAASGAPAEVRRTRRTEMFERRSSGVAVVRDVQTHATISSDHSAVTFLPGRFVLSDGRLDEDRPARNPTVYIAHLVTLANEAGLPERPADFEPVRKFQRAQVVLSEGTRLGDLNTRTPPVDWVLYEGPKRLSDGALVSGDPADAKRTRRTEVFERRSAGSALAPELSVATRWSHVLRTHAVGGRSPAYRLSDTRRRLPPVWSVPPTRVAGFGAYEVAVHVRDMMRVDARVSDLDRFTPGQVQRADARAVGDDIALTSINPSRALLSDLYDPVASAFRVSAATGHAPYDGQFWLPLYYVDQPWTDVQVLVGAMHKTENT